MTSDSVKVLILCQAPRECFKSISLINVLNYQTTLGGRTLTIPSYRWENRSKEGQTRFPQVTTYLVSGRAGI